METKYVVIGVLSGLALFPINPAISIIPILIAFLLPVYKSEIQKTRTKSQIPEIALDLSSLWGVLPLYKILKSQNNIHIQKFGVLLEKGTPLNKAIKIISRDAPELQPLLEIIQTCYKTGIDASKLLVNLADEYQTKMSLEDEMKTSTMIERVTILAASAVIVPVVIGAIISLSHNMNFSSMSLLGVSQVPETTKELALLGSKLYVGIYSIVSGVYLALSGRKSLKVGALYSLLLVIASTAVLQAATGISV